MHVLKVTTYPKMIDIRRGGHLLWPYSHQHSYLPFGERPVFTGNTPDVKCLHPHHTIETAYQIHGHVQLGDSTV